MSDELGARLRAIRNQAIEGGMELETADEITEKQPWPDTVKTWLEVEDLWTENASLRIRYAQATREAIELRLKLANLEVFARDLADKLEEATRRAVTAEKQTTVHDMYEALKLCSEWIRKHSIISRWPYCLVLAEKAMKDARWLHLPKPGGSRENPHEI